MNWENCTPNFLCTKCICQNVSMHHYNRSIWSPILIPIKKWLPRHTCTFRIGILKLMPTPSIPNTQNYKCKNQITGEEWKSEHLFSKNKERMMRPGTDKDRQLLWTMCFTVSRWARVCWTTVLLRRELSESWSSLISFTVCSVGWLIFLVIFLVETAAVIFFTCETGSVSEDTIHNRLRL